MKAAIVLILLSFSTGLAQAADRTAEAVSFSNNGVKLTGILVKNPSTFNQGAVVFQQGSGPFSFDGYENEAWGPHKFYIEDVLLDKGYAVLYCNKRGLGGSEGSWQKNSFEGRASDALAAVNYLKSRSDINPEKIGIAGHSQGGWIAMLAAAQDKSIAFVLSLAGPTVGVKAQGIQYYEHTLECKGYSRDKIARKSAGKLKRMKSSAGIGRTLKFIRSAYHWNLIYDYEHDASLKALECPTLLLFAEYDNNVDAQQNQEHLDNLFQDEVPANFQVEVMPGGQHGFYKVANRCVSWEEATTKPFDPEFQKKIAKWLTEEGF